MDAKRDPIQVMDEAWAEARRHPQALADPAFEAYLRRECSGVDPDLLEAFLAFIRPTLH